MREKTKKGKCLKRRLEVQKDKQETRIRLKVGDERADTETGGGWRHDAAALRLLWESSDEVEKALKSVSHD